MGTDCYAVIEVRFGHFGWQHKAEVDINRDSILFGFMAGMNVSSSTSVQPISQPKGWPDDFDSASLLHGGDDEMFGRSWLSIVELRAVHQAYESHIAKHKFQSNCDDIAAVIGFMTAYHVDPKDVRLVFGFG